MPLNVNDIIMYLQNTFKDTIKPTKIFFCLWRFKILIDSDSRILCWWNPFSELMERFFNSSAKKKIIISSINFIVHIHDFTVLTTSIIFVNWFANKKGFTLKSIKYYVETLLLWFIIPRTRSRLINNFVFIADPLMIAKTSLFLTKKVDWLTLLKD